jgi:two-component system OmpR family response regulator
LHILLVEDDSAIRQSLKMILEYSGYTVTSVGSTYAALATLNEAPDRLFSLAITDLLLGDGDGIQVLKAARALPQPIEVILLTGYGTLQTAVEALRGQAFDYLIKPCKPDALLASVAKALVRHQEEIQRRDLVQTLISATTQLKATFIDSPLQAPAVPSGEPAISPNEQRFLELHELKIDRHSHMASFASQNLMLTPTEYSLLLGMAESAQRVLTYSELVEKAYGYTMSADQARALLKSHIYNLRSKLSAGWIKSVRGTGYMLTPMRD